MVRELSDAEIIRLIREGRIDYFEHITRTHTKHIYHFIKSRLFEKNDVDDLVQNTFLSFYKALKHFDSSKPILPYLYQIARNELKMYYRSHKQTLPLDVAAENTIGKQDQYAGTGDLHRKMSILSEDQQLALKLIGEGYSYQEIADRLKKPLNTARTIIRRARLSIKQEKHDEA